MSVNRLDNELSAFLRAQEVLGDDTHHQLEVSCATPLMKYVDPAKLQGRLGRVGEMKFLPAQVEYLGTTGRFTAEFLAWLETNPWPNTRVLSKGKDLMVSVEGSPSELALVEVPISVQLHDLYYVGIFNENDLNANMIVGEGIRRLQTKLDLLRNCGVRFYEAGTRSRYGFDWHSLLLQVILGDASELLLGTTNVGIAMSYGLRPFTAADVGAILGPTSVREMESMLEGNPGATLVVSGVNAFEIAHLHSHFGDRLVFEWGADLTSDMGPAGRSLPLSFTTT